MLQRLQIALAQIKAVSNTESCNNTWNMDMDFCSLLKTCNKYSQKVLDSAIYIYIYKLLIN